MADWAVSGFFLACFTNGLFWMRSLLAKALAAVI